MCVHTCVHVCSCINKHVCALICIHNQTRTEISRIRTGFKWIYMHPIYIYKLSTCMFVCMYVHSKF